MVAVAAAGWVVAAAAGSRATAVAEQAAWMAVPMVGAQLRVHCDSPRTERRRTHSQRLPRAQYSVGAVARGAWGRRMRQARRSLVAQACGASSPMEASLKLERAPAAGKDLFHSE